MLHFVVCWIMHLTCCHDVPAPCQTFEIMSACVVLEDVTVYKALLAARNPLLYSCHHCRYSRRGQRRRWNKWVEWSHKWKRMAFLLCCSPAVLFPYLRSGLEEKGRLDLLCMMVLLLSWVFCVTLPSTPSHVAPQLLRRWVWFLSPLPCLRVHSASPLDLCHCTEHAQSPAASHWCDSRYHMKEAAFTAEKCFKKTWCFIKLGPIKSGSEAPFTFSFSNINWAFATNVHLTKAKKQVVPQCSYLGKGKLIFSYQVSHLDTLS